jgi:hypothetical protein
MDLPRAAPAAIFAIASGNAFFKVLDRPRLLSMMASPGRELAITKAAQFAAHCVLIDRNAKFLSKPLNQIDHLPVHQAMHRRDRARFNSGNQSTTLLVIQAQVHSRLLAFY